jgi:hypothetical protein
LKILYNSPQHFRSLIAVVGIWIYAAFNFYLLGFYVKYFPGDVFTNFLVMTFAEVIAPIVLYLIQGKYVTKYVTRVLLLGAAAFSFVYILNYHFGNTVYIPAIIFFMRIFVKGTYSLGYYANGKLFPILVKPKIFSLTNSIARPSRALSTMVTNFLIIKPNIPINLGEINLITSIIFLSITTLLPDSDNTEQEMEKLMKKKEKMKMRKPIEVMIFTLKI